MAQIKKLSAELIAKIAAGQVVERPASVVKELIENSLDAKALHITIELKSAGKKKLIVTDDGCGMSQEDLQVCFLHHTTSKLFTPSELYSIYTFGFRGEALSSIAAVAQVRIETKQKNELAGTFVEIQQGDLIKTGAVGMPTGTRVIVSGLFTHIPARQKFLKSDATELTHVLQVITECSLAHPTISFTVVHNKKTTLELPANQSLLERSAQLLSDHVTQNLLPIAVQSEHFQLSGFIGKPQLGTQSLMRQFLFVNRRSVRSTAVSHVVKEVFSSLLEPRSYPTFLFSIQLSPELVDINVDPQKTRVKFLIESELLRDLRLAVAQVLDSANLTYNQRGANGFYDEFIMDPGIAQVVKNQGDGWNIKDAELLENAEVLQVHNVYLVAPTKRGMLIVDQHAAHERILFQEFLEKFHATKRKETLQLEKKVLLSLPLAEAEMLSSQLDVFKKLGFEIVATQIGLEQQEITKTHKSSSSKPNFNKPSFHKKSTRTVFEVGSIPAVFKTRNTAKLIQELLHDLIEQKYTDVMDTDELVGKKLDVGTHRTLAYLACRTAIKAGEKLTQKERLRLIEKLQATEGKYTCPHGRPVEVEIDIKYLNLIFKRVV